MYKTEIDTEPISPEQHCSKTLEGLERMPAGQLKGNFPHNKSVLSHTGKLLTVRAGNSARRVSGSKGPHKVQDRGELGHKLSLHYVTT